MINFNVSTKVNERGIQRPQETNGASPKSQMNRKNNLMSVKGMDVKQM
jgi:hypothetical protein